MNKYLNLYTFLIDNVSRDYIYSNKIKNHINNGIITVNSKKPNDINMRLFTGDIIRIDEDDYVITNT